MKIYRIVFTATVGQALIKANDLVQAARKLEATPHGEDTADVKFEEWEEPELLDIIPGEDIEETNPSASMRDRDEIERFWPVSPQEELLLAAREVRAGWGKNLTAPMARLNAAIEAVEED